MYTPIYLSIQTNISSQCNIPMQNTLFHPLWEQPPGETHGLKDNSSFSGFVPSRRTSVKLIFSISPSPHGMKSPWELPIGKFVSYLRHDHPKDWGLAGFQLATDVPLATLPEPLVGGKNDLMICLPWKNDGFCQEPHDPNEIVELLATGGLVPLVHRCSVWLWTLDLNQQQYGRIGSSGFDWKYVVSLLVLWFSMISICVDKEQERNDFLSIYLHFPGCCRFCNIFLFAAWTIYCTISNVKKLPGRWSLKNDGMYIGNQGNHCFLC